MSLDQLINGCSSVPRKELYNHYKESNHALAAKFAGHKYKRYSSYQQSVVAINGSPTLFT